MGRALSICKIVSACTGLILVVLGASFKWSIFPSVVNSMVMSTLQLSPDNKDTWDAWVTPAVDPYMKFTFFNVTNVEAVKAGTAKPQVVEIGPFTYREVRRKENIMTLQEEISFGSYIAYVFEEDLSCDTCKIDTEVTIINPVVAIVSYMLEDLKDMVYDLPPITIAGMPLTTLFDLIGTMSFAKLNEFINCKKPYAIENDLCDDMFLTGTPDNLLYQGVESGMVKSLWFLLTDKEEGITPLIYVALTMIFPEQEITPEQVEQVIDQLLALITLPPMIDLEQGIFGLQRGINSTKSWWKINNGKYNMDKYNQIIEYSGESKLPDSWWIDFGSTPSADQSGLQGICKEIRGTDGQSAQPGIDKDYDLWLFSSDLCRSIWLTFTKEVDLDGVKTYQFTPPADAFSFSNPDNYCYCPWVRKCAVAVPENDTWDVTTCKQSRCIDGLLFLQGCNGVPIIMSTPHYLDADPDLVEAIDGINPIREDHVTYINIEPMTGMALEVHKKIQISVPLVISSYFDIYSNLQKETVFPIFWLDEGADIDEDNLKTAKSMLVTPFLAVDIGVGIAMGLGGVLMIGVVVLHVVKRS